MQADFESQFIFKLTSIVFDIGSTAELLRFQIQVVMIPGRIISFM
jgi:hypothetical protein